jgi:hypothetical protein
MSHQFTVGIHSPTLILLCDVLKLHMQALEHHLPALREDAEHALLDPVVGHLDVVRRIGVTGGAGFEEGEELLDGVLITAGGEGGATPGRLVASRYLRE